MGLKRRWLIQGASQEAERRSEADAKAKADAAEKARLAQLAKEQAQRQTPLVEHAPATIGNVLPIPAERLPFAGDENTLHKFPARRPPVTRFEEFNWFLFRASIGAPPDWPETLERDFATNIRVEDREILETKVRLRLRPQRPVIIDRLGWWATTSERLEMDPDMDDPLADLYLSLPAERRPIVVSLVPGVGPSGSLLFLRYGFETLTLFPRQLEPYPQEALAYVLEAFTNEQRKEWQGFSVARMRKELNPKYRAVQQATQTLREAQQIAQKMAHENRFVRLYNLVEGPDNVSSEPAKDGGAAT